jgi:hypothetical protein
MKQTVKMANKKIVMGMLAMVLTFGLSAAVYGQNLNGTWVPEFDEDEDDAELAFLALMNSNLTLNNGKIDSRFIRGTYTTRNNQITITITHWSGKVLAAFLNSEYDDDDDDLIGKARQSEWFSKEQVRVLFTSTGALSAEEIKELLDALYPTTTTPIIGGKKFTLPVFDVTFVKK